MNLILKLSVDLISQLWGGEITLVDPKTFQPGDLYVHREGGEYKLLSITSKTKINGKWELVYTYQSLVNGEYYSRTPDNFERSFKRKV